MLKNKQRILIIGVVSILLTIGLISLWEINTGQKRLRENKKNVYDMALESGYSGDIENWAKSILGKSVIQKKGTWWIDNHDTGVRAEDKDVGKKDIIVTGCFQKDGHMWIKLSNDKKIDGGKINSDIKSLEIEYSVQFLDFDGSLLKKEMVKRGEAAHEPKIPERKGYKFRKWDKNFESINEDIVITAQYIKSGSPVLFSEKVKVKPGEKGVKVPIKINKNPGILGMEIAVSYDEKVMKLVGASNGQAFKGVLNFTKGKLLNSGCKYVWDGQEISKKETKNGEILVLNFDVYDTAKKGTYLIDITYEDGNIVDNALSPVTIYVEGGEMVIQ